MGIKQCVLDTMEALAAKRTFASKSKLGQALHYLKEQWPNLVNDYPPSSLTQLVWAHLAYGYSNQRRLPVPDIFR